VDETRANALKRKFDEVQQKRDTYKELYQILQLRSEKDALDILRRIRTGAGVEAILKHIKDGDLLVELALSPNTDFRYQFPDDLGMPPYFLNDQTNPYLSSFIYQAVLNPSAPTQDSNRGYETVYSVPYHAATHIDVRIDSIHPSKWTTVSTDDDMMRELLHIFFMYEYTSFPFLHKDYFLDHMAAGRRKFCSPLLVNAIFAGAWVSG
jgi:hypothetical protein